MYQYGYHAVGCDFVIIKLDILILCSFLHSLQFIHLVLSNLLSIILDGFPNKLYFQQLILPTLANVLDEFTANKENNSMCLWLLICTSKSNIVHSFFTSILSEINYFLGVKLKHVHPSFCALLQVWFGIQILALHTHTPTSFFYTIYLALMGLYLNFNYF